jgi:uncharacterized protein
MSAPLPDQLDPWRAVQHGSSFAGVVPLQSLPRLAAAVLGAEGPARYAIEFGRDADGRAVARGRVSMTLQLTCQRCLEAIAVQLDATIALALVRRVSGADDLGLAAIEGVPEDLDAVPLGQDPIRPLDLVEDELLLAIPQIPLHAAQECGSSGSPAPPESETRDNPFAVLAALRGRDSGTGSDES